MKITVINGSPKGTLSLTLQLFKQAITDSKLDIEYEVVNVGHRIRVLEQQYKEVEKILNTISSSDGIVWCAPVCFYSVSAQLIRFIEIVMANKSAALVFKNKTTTFFSTSIHIGDNFAHNYMHSICGELEMNYIPGFSSSYFEIKSAEHKELLTKFVHLLAISISKKISFEQRTIHPHHVINNDLHAIEPMTSTAKKLLIIDSSNWNDSLQQMIELAMEKLKISEHEVVDLNKITIHGGCVHCLSCLNDRQCFYKDDLKKIYTERVFTSDIIILAFSISARSVPYKVKCFIDRFFSHGVYPILQNKLTGIIVSGHYKSNIDLQNILAHTFQTLGAPLIGAISDDYENREYIKNLIESLCFRLVWSYNNKFNLATDFLGLGSHIIHSHFLPSQRLLYWNDYQHFLKNFQNPFQNNSNLSKIGMFFFSSLCKSKYLRGKVQKLFKYRFVKKLHALQ